MVKRIKEATGNDVGFDEADEAAVQRGTATYENMASIANRVQLSYHKAQLLCNVMKAGGMSQANAIPKGCRGPAFDMFVPNDRASPFKAMLYFQKERYPGDYAEGVWPLPSNHLDEFYKKVNVNMLVPHPGPDTIENGEAMGDMPHGAAGGDGGEQ